MDNFKKILTDRKIEYAENYVLSRVSSFKIGGAADIAVFPKNRDELCETLKACKCFGIKSAVAGKTSNILFDDSGFRGAVIFTKLVNESEIVKKEDSAVIYAECGVSLATLAMRAADAGCRGIEFLHGIPGTLGGAVCMNAGAFGSEICEVIDSVVVYDTEKDVISELSKEDCDFSYRHSVFSAHPSLICLGAYLSLGIGDKNEAYAKMNEYKEKRMLSQPYTEPSAGSFFKRPQCDFAARLIDVCGLKGISVGGAAVSEKHAGFIVNKGNATSKDVCELANKVREAVFERFGVTLEWEVKYIN